MRRGAYQGNASVARRRCSAQDTYGASTRMAADVKRAEAVADAGGSGVVPLFRRPLHPRELVLDGRSPGLLCCGWRGGMVERHGHANLGKDPPLRPAAPVAVPALWERDEKVPAMLPLAVSWPGGPDGRVRAKRC